MDGFSGQGDSWTVDHGAVILKMPPCSSLVLLAQNTLES
jgi:hypothetical protein